MKRGSLLLSILPCLVFSYSFRLNKQLYPTTHKANEGSLENILLGDGGLLEIKNSSLAEIEERLSQKRQVFCNILTKPFYGQCNRLFDCGLCSASLNCGWCEQEHKCLPVNMENKEQPACKKTCGERWVSNANQCNTLQEISSDPDIINYRMAIRRRHR